MSSPKIVFWPVIIYVAMGIIGYVIVPNGLLIGWFWITTVGGIALSLILLLNLWIRSSKSKFNSQQQLYLERMAIADRHLQNALGELLAADVHWEQPNLKRAIKQINSAIKVHDRRVKRLYRETRD